MEVGLVTAGKRNFYVKCVDIDAIIRSPFLLIPAEIDVRDVVEPDFINMSSDPKVSCTGPSFLPPSLIVTIASCATILQRRYQK